MPAEFGIEALKAQAVAARTFAVSSYGGVMVDKSVKVIQEQMLCDTVQCQVYMNKEERLKSMASE